MKKNIASPKRVLLVIPRPTRGGATQVLLNLLEQTTQNKSFIFFTIYNDASTLQEAFSPLVEKSFASPLDKPSRARNALIKVSQSAYKTLKRIYFNWVYHKVKPDLIYINTVSDTPYARQALTKPTPIIVHAHEMDFLVTLRMQEKWIRQLAARCTTWIVCSKAAGEFYNTVYSVPFEKQKLVHGPVSITRTAYTQQGYYRGASSCQSPAILIGVSASFTYLKGADIWIKAIQLVKNLYKGPVRFAWLGLDPQAQNTGFYRSMMDVIIQNQLEQDITLFPTTSEVGNFYIDIDIFVLPSRTEAFPISILEAMLFEKPVVAMDVGGIREVVDAETGYLVKDRTPEGLAEGLLYFLESEERRRDAGQRGRQRVLENFEAQVQVKKWIEILNQA